MTMVAGPAFVEAQPRHKGWPLPDTQGPPTPAGPEAPRAYAGLLDFVVISGPPTGKFAV